MDRNYKEDQSNEIEALDSIYSGDMEILQVEPLHKFKIPIATEEFSPDAEDQGLSCDLVFTYTEKYPDTAPLIEIEEPTNFQDGFEKKLIEHISQTIEEFIGMEMIFSLVSSAQEWLNQRWDCIKQENEDEKLAILKASEEAERKRFEGTRVTIESFFNWKTSFEYEMGITQRKEKALLENKKLTGRELFMQDITLNESDLKFLLEAGDSVENVKIDESLFQNINDLELDSDSEDDDYVPGRDDDSD